jgi:cation:H+ antiporter
MVVSERGKFRYSCCMPVRIMFSSFPFPVVISIFLLAAAGVWIAGIHLSEATDTFCSRFDLGEALGGMIFLAIVTNLPEVAITASGALRHDLSIAVGNILGGIAIQTVVLVLLDAVGLSKTAPLSCRAASPAIVLEGVLVIAVLAVVIMGTQLPASLIFARITPAGGMIVLLWLTGVWIISKRRNFTWPEQEIERDKLEEQCEPSAKRNNGPAGTAGRSMAHTIMVFVAGALATLLCGVMLEITSEALAHRVGMSGVVFGATALAAATALPEVSTGLTAVKLGDYRMAVSDVLGGNAFLPVLFPMASILSGQAVLPLAQKTDIYLSSLGILLTAVYMTGLIYRPTRQIARMGIDSFAVLLLYLIGVAGLAVMSSG